MKWFENLSTRGKLLVGFGLMVGFLAAIVLTAYAGISSIQTSQRQLSDAMANVADVAQVEAGLNANRVAILSMLLSSETAVQERWVQELHAGAEAMGQAMQRLVDRNRDHAWYSDVLRDYQTIRSAYAQARDQAIQLISQGKSDEAKALATGAQDERFLKLRSLAGALDARSAEDSHQSVKASERKVTQTLYTCALIGGVAVALAVILSLLISRSIANPLRDISLAADGIASGELTEVPTDERKDEIGGLSRAFHRMVQSLRRMAETAEGIADGNLRVDVKPVSAGDRLGHAFASMIANLRRMTSEIAEGAGVLGASAAQIVASSSQLASGSSQTATAVAETTTTVEEVRQTAQVSTQKAHYVAESAQKASSISETGRQNTEEVVSGMARIREQMDCIAQSMMRLSEQTQAIGQIITTVDDLAQQSNLLAVNASIEAAKAGDQGRGFAIVAQEVKSLAEQSKAATTQVRNILNDIQKATGQAVMATEQGAKAVEAGGRQSAQAGDSIVTLAGSVNDAAQAATQIAASSQQQLVGMDQVAVAMESIKQASAQNVDSAKQLEGAARNLDELGKRLRELVSRYKLTIGSVA